jgi:hypothetical protein
MTGPSSGLLFLSWLRTGMLASLDQAAGAGGSLDRLPAANAQPVIAVNATGAHGQFTAVLHGPGEVVGIDPAQVVRMEPPDGAFNVETAFVPLVEFDRPDLPWLASPATVQPGTPTGPDPRNGLLPWLCLVVLEYGSVALDGSAAPLPRLTVPLSQLPDPAQAWLWAHAQLLLTAGETVQTVLDQAPDRTLSRLIGPRRLRPATRYLAAVVPLFEAGRQAGLGNPPAHSDGAPPALSYAWTVAPAGSSAATVLPVYLHWSFTTGDGADFRTLALKLKPTLTGQAGVRPLDIGHAGSGLPGPGAQDPAWTIPFEGVVVGSAISQGSWPSATLQSTYQAALAGKVAATPAELTPPQYGAATPLDAAGLAAGPQWLRQLNLDPRYRALAALGTTVVQTYAEPLMASAWQQAGQLREVNDLLRRAQLARELSASMYARRIGEPGAAVLPDDRLLQVSTPVHDQVSTPSGSAATVAGMTTPAVTAPVTVADQLAASPSAAAATSVAFRRLARPTGPVARRALAAGAAVPVSTPVTAPVTALATGQLKPVPAVKPVPGATSFDQLSSSVTWSAVTPALVSAAVYPWEQGAPSGNATGTGVPPVTSVLSAAAAPDAGSSRTEPVEAEFVDIESLRTDEPLVVNSAAFVPTSEVTGRVLLATTETAGETPSAVVVPPPSVRLSTQYGYGADLVVNTMLGLGLNFDAHPQQGWTSNPLPASWFGNPAWSWQYTDLMEVTGVARLEVSNWDYGDAMGANATFYWQPGYLTALGPSTSPVNVGGSSTGIIGYRVPWSAVVVTNLTGYGPSVVLLWNTGSGRFGTTGPAPNTTYYSVGWGLTPTGAPTQWTSPQPFAANPPGPVSATGSGGLIYLLGSDGSLTVVALTNIGSVYSAHTVASWQTGLPRGYRGGGIVSADFGGSTGADIVHVMSTDGGTVFRVAYDVDSSGAVGAYSELTPLPIGLPAGSLTTSIGVTSYGSAQRRAATTAAFRTAAAATQARQSRISTLPTKPAEPEVPVTQAATAVRSQLDPVITITQATTARLSVDIGSDTSSDPLQPMVATPVFRVATYDLFREQFSSLVFPGGTLPDNSVTGLLSNAAAIEAFLVGLNNELSRELLWRQFPTQHGRTYFRRFWDRRDATGAPMPEIGPIENWTATSPLGSHGDAAVDSLLLVVRGELLRRMPATIIYAAPAVADITGRTPDLSRRTDPLFTAQLDPDLAMFSFPLTAAEAVGGDGNGEGWFFVFAEHPTAVRFGLNQPTAPSTSAALPVNWQALDWNQALGPLNPGGYLDGSAHSPLAGTTLTDNGTGTDHRWGFSSAHMAHIMLRPPYHVAIHGSSLVQLA